MSTVFNSTVTLLIAAYKDAYEKATQAGSNVQHEEIQSMLLRMFNGQTDIDIMTALENVRKGSNAATPTVTTNTNRNTTGIVYKDAELTAADFMRGAEKKTLRTAPRVSNPMTGRTVLEGQVTGNVIPKDPNLKDNAISDEVDEILNGGANENEEIENVTDENKVDPALPSLLIELVEMDDDQLIDKYGTYTGLKAFAKETFKEDIGLMNDGGIDKFRKFLEDKIIALQSD